MLYTISFKTQEEREAVTVEQNNAGRVLKEVQIHADGNFLVFEDVTPVKSLEDRIAELEAKLAALEPKVVSLEAASVETLSKSI